MTPGIMAWCDQKMANVRLYNTGYLKWDHGCLRRASMVQGGCLHLRSVPRRLAEGTHCFRQLLESDQHLRGWERSAYAGKCWSLLHLPARLQLQFVGTFVLVFVVFAVPIGVTADCIPGYAVNHARDLGPRIMTAMFGYGAQVFTLRHHYWIWGSCHRNFYQLSVSATTPQPRVICRSSNGQYGNASARAYAMHQKRRELCRSRRTPGICRNRTR
ncbi:hypothetical protein BJV77DRAFT_1001132 [Russula vinacea]|nr:hypothetical protein BJV77DRAFT_1001132 [Russula vinacea]